MALTYSYSKARENFAKVLEHVTTSNDIAVITRRNRENVVMISETELAGLLETAHLLRSPKNARRLLAALHRVKKGQGKPKTLVALRGEFGLEK
jgi:antitoxin YefM